MSTPFEWARQAGIQMTGGFAVVAECVTLDELARFAQIAISQDRSSAPQIAINPEVIGYVAPQREWAGLTDEEVDDAARYCVKSGQSVNAAIRAIEAKLKERNNG